MMRGNIYTIMILSTYSPSPSKIAYTKRLLIQSERFWYIFIWTKIVRSEGRSNARRRLERCHVRIPQSTETCSTFRRVCLHFVLCYVLLQSGTLLMVTSLALVLGQYWRSIPEKYRRLCINTYWTCMLYIQMKPIRRKTYLPHSNCMHTLWDIMYLLQLP